MMTLQEALAAIREFWQEPEWPFYPATDAAQHLARLRQEFAHPLPPTLVEYIEQAAPETVVDFTGVGNPIEVYQLSQLGFRQEGYNFNPVTQQVLPDWPDHWFILANEGGDPILLDLQAPEQGVTQLYHGAGDWEAGVALANSIGQFLLCAAARQHALLHLGEGEDGAIIDDAEGFRLAPRAAAWLFPRLRQWAGPYYDAWCADFDNAHSFEPPRKPRLP